MRGASLEAVLWTYSGFEISNQRQECGGPEKDPSISEIDITKKIEAWIML